MGNGKSNVSNEDLQRLQKYFDEFPMKMLESLKETVSSMVETKEESQEKETGKKPTNVMYKNDEGVIASCFFHYK